MDIVITYVDGSDPLWMEEYARATSSPLLDKRYRDWGFLKYLFRGIEMHMPFVRNVFLVLASESQIPLWMDCSKVKIILHKDIIPERYLPVFNSTAIECFIHRIPGLGEQYLYFNDDMYPMADCSPEDFFDEGRATIGFSRHILAPGLFKKQVRNSDRLARKYAGVGRSPGFVRPQHICSPMLKSACEELFAKAASDIELTISTVREDYNVNQYLFLDYMLFVGRALNRRISKVHLSMKAASPAKIAKEIISPSHQFACINDVRMSGERCDRFRTVLTEAFETHFPEKSGYEL